MVSGLKKGAVTILALALAMLSTFAANCVNPCVDTTREDVCKIIPTAGKDAQTAPEKCCPTSGPYGAGTTGMYGIACPTDRNDCLNNYWQLPDSVCNPKGCCYAPRFLQYSCQELSLVPVICDYLGGTAHAAQCSEIADCEMGCCCYISSTGTVENEVTFGSNCTKNHGPDAMFLAGTRFIDDCSAACSYESNTGGVTGSGVTGNIEDWNLNLNKGYGIYVSSRLICLHDARGDARVVKEKNDFTACPVTGDPCPDYASFGTGPLTCNSTCEVNYTWNLNWNDPYNLRYEGLSASEGGCRIAAKVEHFEKITIGADLQNTDYNKEVTWKSPTWPESGPYWKPKEIFNKIVSWDNIQDQCTLIGGDWLTDAKAAQLGVNPSSFNGYRCCGDDWIYVNNRAVSYAPGITTPTLQQRINTGTACLYNVSSVDMVVSGGVVQQYKCKRSAEAGDHLSYDLSLQYDDENQERTFALSEMGFYFPGETGTDEADVGKWTGSLGEHLYCRYYFNNSNGKGDMFQWMTLGDAGEIGPIECELHLGYNWTGTKCCGNNPGETFNDIEKECNAQVIGTYVMNSVPYTSRQFEPEFNLRCDAQKTRNGACWQGRFIEDKTSLPANSAVPWKVNILTVNGTLNGCKDRNGANPITDSALLATGSRNYDKCTYISENVCAYYNDSWIRKSTDTNSIAYSMLGYRGIDTVKESALPYNPSSKECCFSGSCWNGSACVPHGKVYLYESGIFKEFPETEWRNHQGKEIYACQNSTWAKSKPQFNWYDDTTKVNFCQQPHSCMCAGSVTNPYDYSCDSKYVDSNNCLKEPNVFKGDHYCQSTYSGSAVTSSKWTSRTKMMALQMIAIAGGSDYTLFCDKYSKSVNYPVPLEMIKNNINSVCTMSFDGKNVLGVSLNPTTGDSMLFDVRPLLYSSTNGLIDKILGEGNNVPNCNNAIQNSNDAQHGTYKKCVSQSDKIWYNNRTKSLIYSKTGLSYSDSLPVPDWNSLDNSLLALAQPILDHASQNKAQIESGTNAKPGIGMILNVKDFNRLYITKRGSRTILGFVETKYDADFTQDIRNVLGVSYSGFSSISCQDIIHAYPESYCGTQGGRLIVLDKGPGEFDLWQDLTSKVRIS